MLNYYSTADEIQETNPDTALLPVGSTEQHGPHLPIATDFMIAGAIGEMVAERLGAYLLPALPISTCREQMGRKATVWINPDTFYNVLKDIFLCLKEQGFKKIVLLLAHGGIFIGGPAVREVNATNPDIKVVKVDLVQFLQTREMNEILECRDNLHACEYETSLMLYLKEKLVRKDRIVDCLPGVPRDYLNYASFLKYCKDGVWGMPSLATREKGEKIFKLLVDKSVEYVNEVVNIFKNTEKGDSQ